MRTPSTFTLSIAAIFGVMLAVWATPQPHPSLSPNLIRNHLATEMGAGGYPTGWSTGQWGSLTASFSRQRLGVDERYALKVEVTNYSSGDAKWYFTPVPVIPSSTYIFTDYYRSSVATDTVAEFRDDCGRSTYLHLGTNDASDEIRSSSYTFTAPASAAQVTIFHVVAADGELWTADYSLKRVETTKPAPGLHLRLQPDGATSSAIGIDRPVQPVPVPGDSAVINGSAEERARDAAERPSGWTPNSWGANDAGFSYSTDSHSGNRSLRTDITRYVDGDAKWVFDSIRLEPGRDYLFSDYYKATAASRVLAAVTTASGTVDYIELPQALPEADWKQYKGVFTMPPDGVDVSIYHLLDRNGTLLTDDYAVSPYSLAGFSRGLVSLTFDDGWRNIYTNALPLLRKYGFASTQYVLAGKADDPEYMTTDMMAEFRGSGSEIASHTVTHPHLTQITSTCMRAEVADSQEYLRNAFGASAAADFAPPYGEFDESVLQAAREFYRSSRSTQVGFNARNSTDVYDIKVQNVENTTTTADVRRWVETAYRERTWLVLVYHEVDAQPADPTYAVSPSVLDEELQIVEDSGLAVMTVDQALDEITPQLHRE